MITPNLHAFAPIPRAGPRRPATSITTSAKRFIPRRRPRFEKYIRRMLPSERAARKPERDFAPLWRLEARGHRYMCARNPANPRIALAKRSEKLSDIASEKLGFLHCGEMAASRHGRPARDVV